MPTPCNCGQATASPTCSLTAGAGITITGSNPYNISATSATAWTAYTPTLTNLTLGNGTNESRYKIVGKTIDVVIALQFGTTSTFAAAQFQIGLPAGITPFLGATQIVINHVIGVAGVHDNSANLYYSLDPIITGNANPISFRFGDDAGGSNNNVQQAVPITFANLDKLVSRQRFEII